MLQRHSIQSTSDQENYIHYASIAANAATGVTPEQAAVWTYPLSGGDKEETVFNMINAMLLRIHQSGNLSTLDSERKALVKEGISYYKKIRKNIGQALPFWPLGLSKFTDEFVSFGLKTEEKVYLAIWRRKSNADTCLIPVLCLLGKEVTVRQSYPEEMQSDFAWNANCGMLSVNFLKDYSARLFEFTVK